jgi:hypothetical protein
MTVSEAVDWYSVIMGRKRYSSAVRHLAFVHSEKACREAIDFKLAF